MRAANASAAPPLPFPDCSSPPPCSRPGPRRRRTGATSTLGSGDFFIGVQRDPGANLSDFDVARFFNKARCDCDETVFVYVALTNAGFAKRTSVDRSGNIEFWIGSDCANVSLSRPALHPPRVPDGGGVPERRSRDHGDERARAQHVHRLAAPSVDGGTHRRRLHAESDLYVSRGRPVVLPDDLRAHRTTARERRSPSPRARSTSTSRRRPSRTRLLLTATGGQQAVTLSWPGVDSAVITDVLGYQVLCNRGGRAAGVLGRNLRTRLPDLLQEPHARVRCSGARPALHLFAAAGADVAIVSGQDPAERHHLRRGGRRDRSERQPQHPGHPLRDRDQDQELLRRLPQRRRSRSGRRRHRRPVHAGRGHDLTRRRWPAWARGSRSPRS